MMKVSDMEIVKTWYKIPEYFTTLLSPCCNVRVLDGAGCPTCKVCPKCREFLGCWNLAGYEIKDGYYARISYVPKEIYAIMQNEGLFNNGAGI